MPSAPRQMWAITINTGYGVTEEDKDRVTKFFNKQYRAFLITEKESEKQHYHGGIMFEKEVIQGNVRNQLLRLFPDFDEKQKKHGIIVKNWYNLDWYQNYCHKSDCTIVIMDTFKPDSGEIFPFPDPDDKKDLRPLGAWYVKMEKMILEDERFQEPYDERVIRKAVNTYQIIDRVIEPIIDPKLLQQKVRFLVKFINHEGLNDYGHKRFRTEEEDWNEPVSLCPKCDCMKIESMQDIMEARLEKRCKIKDICPEKLLLKTSRNF